MKGILYAVGIAVAFLFAPAHATMIVDDFESGLPSGSDGGGVPIGFYTFQGAGSTISVSTTSTPPTPVPGSAPSNDVLQLDIDSTSFAGILHGFENVAINTWTPQDWSTFEGISFFMFGNNSGSDLFIDILDNRNPGSTSDDAERFTVAFADDFAGWQLFEVPFSSFTRKEIGNGAPDDGLTLTAMHGYALGILNTGGPRTFYVDDVKLFGGQHRVPEPTTLALFGLGLLGAGYARRRRFH